VIVCGLRLQEDWTHPTCFGGRAARFGVKPDRRTSRPGDPRVQLRNVSNMVAKQCNLKLLESLKFGTRLTFYEAKRAIVSRDRRLKSNNLCLSSAVLLVERRSSGEPD